MEEKSREDEIKAIHRDYGWFYRLLTGAVLIGIGVFVGLIIYADPQARQAYVINVFTGVLSLGATALIFDELNRQRSLREYKRQLVDDAASMSNEVAKNAVHQLRRKGWLEGENGLLKRANLSGANLEGADLRKANLQGANLRNANLQGADLNGAQLQEADLRWANLQGAALINANLQGAALIEANLQGAALIGTNLQGADLIEANLQEANLNGTNLQGAHLMDANLQEANLNGANLQGADLMDANLQGAALRRARYDVKTVLPDISNWAPESDMARFMDSTREDFWRSDLPWSPAYRDKRKT